MAVENATTMRGGGVMAQATDTDYEGGALVEESVDGASPVKRTKSESRARLLQHVEERYSVCPHKMHGHTAAPGQCCKMCGKLIWGVHKQGMRCSLCGMITHIRCLPQVVATGSTGSSVGSNPADQLSPRRCSIRCEKLSPCDIHVVQHVKLLKPTTCVHCKTLIYFNKGVTCMTCHQYFHQKCSETLGIKRVSVTQLRKEAQTDYNTSESSGKEEASAVLHNLLQDFSKRWPLWQRLSLANPVSHLKVYNRHSKSLAQLVKWFDVFSDAAVCSDLSLAMLYAKAVYGVAYEDGHLKSVGAAIRMHTIWKPFKNLGRDFTSRENDIAVMQGIDALDSKRELLVSEWSNQVYKPAFAFFADHVSRWLVLTIRGTVSDKDTLTDLAAEPCPFLHGEGHSGIVRCTEFVLGHERLMATLAEASAKYPGYRIVATGHSLGAAVATLFVISCRLAPGIGATWGDRTEAIVFGPPPTVDKTLLETVNQGDYLTSVVCGADAVARTSCRNLERLAREVAGFKDPTTADNPHKRLNIPGRLLLITSPIHRPHTKLKHKPTTKLLSLPPLYREEDVSTTVEQSMVLPADLTAEKASHWCLGVFWCAKNMFNDHLPDRYHCSLQYWSSLNQSEKVAAADVLSASPVSLPSMPPSPDRRGGSRSSVMEECTPLEVCSPVLSSPGAAGTPKRDSLPPDAGSRRGSQPAGPLDASISLTAAPFPSPFPAPARTVSAPPSSPPTTEPRTPPLSSPRPTAIPASPPPLTASISPPCQPSGVGQLML